MKAIILILGVGIAVPLVATIGIAIFKCIDYVHDCKKYGKETADELQALYKKKGI